MTPDTAIEIMAREVLTSANAYPEWEDFPEIGEHDWERVVARFDALCREQGPTKVQLDEAYETLKERAEHAGGDG